MNSERADSRTTLTRRLRAAAAGLAIMASIAAPLVAARDGFRLRGLAGGELTETELSKGTTIVVVWASWSPRCRNLVEQVGGLTSRWGSRARIVTVNFEEERAAIEKFLSGRTLSAPTYLDADGEFSKSLSVTTLPGLVVYKDGTVAFRGRLGEDVDDVLRDALK